MPCLRRRCLLCALSDLNEWRKVREAFLLSYNFYVPLGWPSRCFIVNNNAFYDGMIQRPQKGPSTHKFSTSNDVHLWLEWHTTQIMSSVDCTMNIRVHIFVVFILSPTFTIVETTNAPRLMDVLRFQWEQAGIEKKRNEKTRRNIFFSILQTTATWKALHFTSTRPTPTLWTRFPAVWSQIVVSFD